MTWGLVSASDAVERVARRYAGRLEVAVGLARLDESGGAEGCARGVGEAAEVDARRKRTKVNDE